MFGIQSLTVSVHNGEPQREQHKHDRVSDGNNVTFNNSKPLLATVTATGITPSSPRPRLALLLLMQGDTR